MRLPSLTSVSAKGRSVVHRLVNHSGIVVRTGRNVWRVLVSAETGWTKEQVRQNAARLVATWLGDDSWWYWGESSGQTDIVIGSGFARPIQVFDAALGGAEAAMGVPAGDILGYNGESPEEGIEWKAEPEGFPPCWWVYVEFWWRGPDASQKDWPALLDENTTAVLATPNVCVYPTVQGTFPDLSQGDASSERWEEWWGTTVDDISDGTAGAASVLSVPLALVGAGTSKTVKSAVKWVVGGVVLAILGLGLYSRAVAGSGVRGVAAARRRR